MLTRLHESPPPRLRNAVWGLFAFVTLAGVIGAALSPYLLVKSPLLLVAISAAAHHVALAAASVDPVPLIIVATLRRVLTGVTAYGLGYLYGRMAIEWVELRHPRVARLLRYVERLFERFGVALLVVAPAPAVALFAGSARSRLLFFLPALTLGHIIWNTATQLLGDALSDRTDELVDFLSDYLFESTLVCVLLVFAQQAIRRSRALASRE
jgi:membrane protein DedA with SNARE-associated domain